MHLPAKANSLTVQTFMANKSLSDSDSDGPQWSSPTRTSVVITHMDLSGHHPHGPEWSSPSHPHGPQWSSPTRPHGYLPFSGLSSASRLAVEVVEPRLDRVLKIWLSAELQNIYIYIYSFSRRFYPKRLPRESFTKVHRSLIITTRYPQHCK